jgi:hypothetical protein
MIDVLTISETDTFRKIIQLQIQVAFRIDTLKDADSESYQYFKTECTTI